MREGVGGLFVFGDRVLDEMPGRERLEAFVSGWFFWFYFALGEIKKRDGAPVRSLNVRAGVLLLVIFEAKDG